MRQALGLAARARGRTAPNPPVGALVVRGGRRIAGGLHAGPGRPHAEAQALRKAGERARGATLYVTLEPCAHQGRTPPCVEAVLHARVRRVVIGLVDPDPRTAGRSIARLRRAGVQVVTGVEREACRELVRGFASRVERGRPHTELKLAASLDGRIATRSGESRWITGAPARAYVHELRRRVDAIAVGSRTAAADDPELTARRGRRIVHRPLPVLVDSKLSLSPRARLLRGRRALVLTASGAPARRRKALEAAGARVVAVPTRAGQLDLEAAWQALAGLGVNELLVEGGGALAAALLRAGLVDRLHLLQGPVLIGSEGRPLLGALEVSRLAAAPRPRVLRARPLGDDFLIVLEW
jgi:diaminohydroxyphosphoribosylaminopyrimidine deaminase/5-amino-6-(5-phosphoribosylamino)uracil reductase